MFVSCFDYLVEVTCDIKLKRGGTGIQCSMPKTARLTKSTEWINLRFVERGRTPREIIEKGIQHHLTGLSLLNSIILLG